MKKTTFRCCVLFFIFLFFCSDSGAFNLRKAGNSTISGSTVNSVSQDKDGLIWLGSTSGLSTYDGKNTILIPGYKEVNKVWETVTGTINIEAHYGFNTINKKENTTKTFTMFNHVSFSASDSKGNIFIIQGNGMLFYLSNGQSVFDNIPVQGLTANNIKAFFIDKTDMLRIITEDGNLRSFKIVMNDNKNIFLNEEKIVHAASGIIYCFSDNDDMYIIDNEYKMYKLSFPEYQINLTANLKEIIVSKGKITAAIKFNDDFFFGFESGLYVFRGNELKRIPLNGSVVQLLKDRFQELIWIGTNDKGLYTYSIDPYTIRTTTFNEISSKVNKPVDAVYYDSYGTLWLGTKGDGIVKIYNYNPDAEINNISIVTTSNGLKDNLVSAFAKSKAGLWIGSETGLQFYSYADKSIRKIDLAGNHVEIKKIESIYEQDSVLWVASYGQGIAKIELLYTSHFPQIKNFKLYSIRNGDEVSNRFLSIYKTDKGTLFANNGEGVFYIENEELKLFHNNDLIHVNQIATGSKGKYISATDFGVVKFSSDDTGITTNKIILKNMSVKNILHEDWDNYWLSTDNGIIHFNSESGIYTIFDYSYGLNVTEYLVGASYKDEQKKLFFFGGINGFTTIKMNQYDESMDYMPLLYLDKLTLFGVDQHVTDFVEKAANTEILTLNYNQNIVSVTFKALDFVNGNNYNYYYKIGKDGQWIDNGNSSTVSFADLSPGEYELYIKYFNKIINKQSYSKQLKITILPPWYHSTTAYLLYFFLIMLFGYIIVKIMMNRYQKRKEELLQKAEESRREEVYEAKLDFFINIAHEFCTPLTLIYGPCSQILEYKNLNPSIVRYAEIINRNAQRMNLLIKDLMDFKQIESGHKQPRMSGLPISEIVGKILDSFVITAENANITVEKNYPEKLIWNSDEKFLITILSNLISNAFKYVNNEGTISLEMNVESQNLQLTVSNTGKGIKGEDIGNIFDKYIILSDFQRQSNSSWSRTGLGLTITAGMVRLLGGTIDVKSTPGKITTFTVTLPPVSIDEVAESKLSLMLHEMNIEKRNIFEEHYDYREGRSTVMVIDDDPEMLWFICKLLNDEFNVIPISASHKAVDALSQNHPNLILCDIMMEEIDGISLSKMLKSDQQTSHIPLIIVSAIHEVEKQIEAIESGVEMYITKPFNVDYLKSSIRQLLGRKETLKDYFASPLSAYELSVGKLKHSEHKKFLKQIYSIINKNIQKTDLSAELIAIEMNMSVRSLYRKLKQTSDISILEIIRESRLTVAKDLLMKSKFTVEEIIFKSGFPNRAGFYRAFSGKYGCTPTEFRERNSI